MIEQKATVVSISHGKAWVEPVTTSGCGRCQSICTHKRFFSMKDTRQEAVQVLNPLHAKPGDGVIIGMQGDALILYSVLAYLLPLFSMLIFALLGQELFSLLGMHAELGSILAGVGGLLTGFRLASWLSGHKSIEQVQPVILRHQNLKVDSVVVVV